MSEQGVGKKPREFWIDIDEEDELEIYCGGVFKEHPRQGPLQWQESLIHVVEYSRVEQLEKEKQDLIEALKKTNKIFSSLRSVYGNEWSPQSWNSTLDQMKYNEEILSKLGGADEMRKKE